MGRRGEESVGCPGAAAPPSGPSNSVSPFPVSPAPQTAHKYPAPQTFTLKQFVCWSFLIHTVKSVVCVRACVRAHVGIIAAFAGEER